MDDEIRARLYAVEILLAEMIADRARGLPDIEETVAASLRALKPIIWEYPLQEPTLDAEAGMRSRIEEAVGEEIKRAVARLG